MTEFDPKWTSTALKSRSAAVHYFVNVPDALKSLSFIEKDVRRFPKTHEWAYASLTMILQPTPLRLTPRAPSACHMTLAAQDYIFTAYRKR